MLRAAGGLGSKGAGRNELNGRAGDPPSLSFGGQAGRAGAPRYGPQGLLGMRAGVAMASRDDSNSAPFA